MAREQTAFNDSAPQRELGLEEAGACVVRQAAARAGRGLRRGGMELSVAAGTTPGPVLAQAVVADRDQPPYRRSQRDGYAVRAADCGAPGAVLRLQGAVHAGAAALAAVGPGTCLEIMTGAALPEGADAVVMVERTRSIAWRGTPPRRWRGDPLTRRRAGAPETPARLGRAASCPGDGPPFGITTTPSRGRLGDPGSLPFAPTWPTVPTARSPREAAKKTGELIRIGVAVSAGEHVAEAGSDTARGAVMVAGGRRLDAAACAALASVGCLQPEVFLPARVALITTGDELVAPEATPGAVQIRDANLVAMTALARRAGAEVGLALRLPDSRHAIEEALERAVAEADLIIFSGGASVGAHDWIAPVLAARGAEFHFDAVRIRPGRPVLFGSLGGKLFFGLPGNPVSTWLSFSLLVRPVIEVLSGLAAEAAAAPLMQARLGFAHRGKPLPLAVFRPGRLRGQGLEAVIEPLAYASSADLGAAAAADVFWMIPPGVEELAAGAMVAVVLK